MSDNNKKADDIIEETMQEIFDGLNKAAQEAQAQADESSVTEEKIDLVDEASDDNPDEEDSEESSEEELEEELDDDMEEVEEEREETEAEREYRLHMRRKKIGKITAIVVGVIAVIYIGIALFFGSHFMFFTKINGQDVSMKSVAQIEEDMTQQVKDYVLTIEESDGDKAQIKGSTISAEYVPGEELTKLVKGQNNFLWITTLWNHPEISAEVGVKYNKNVLAKEVEKLECLKEENQVASVNAHPEFKETKFEVVPEVVGTQIDRAAFDKAVIEAVEGFQHTLNLSKSGCYIKPKFLEDSPEVAKAAEAMNSYLGATITYDFNPNTEVVDSAMIATWVTFNENMEVTFNEEAVKAYIDSLAEKYNTAGKPRQFTTARGDTVEVTGGIYGWKINKDEEFAALTANIQNAEVVTREPVYSSRAASHGPMDVGTTYAEVDLTNQMAYFIKDGAVVLQSPVVTGNPNRGNATPQGTYTLTYKTRNAVLRGEKKPDGTYSYESPVKYWMPFNRGIGFHDAPWQASFGGSRYKSHGSHGCINMPTDKAAQMYELISQGLPVICHY